MIKSETLPLGGQYDLSRDEIRALAKYVAKTPSATRFTVWRGTSGKLYVNSGGGKLYNLTSEA